MERGEDGATNVFCEEREKLGREKKEGWDSGATAVLKPTKTTLRFMISCV